MKRHIPNLITSCNLLCGALAVISAADGLFARAFLFVLLGAMFDFFDGMVARLLKVSGPLGVQMDSLADDITFGLAPAVMLFRFLRPAIGNWSLLVLLMAAFAAYRLAKFNIDTRQTTSFRGIATPANAIFWGGITCLPGVVLQIEICGMPLIPWLLLAMSMVSGWLMVSDIPFFSLKIHGWSWQENKTQYIFLVGCLILIGVCIAEGIRYNNIGLTFFAGTACIVWYVMMNCINILLNKSANE